MAGRCAVFIDGGYLDKVMAKDFPGQRIDFEKLSQTMATPDEMLRAYYYHCMPYRSNPPTEDEGQRYSSMHRFTKRLSFLPRFQVRFGRLVYRGKNSEGRPIFIQKRVDCMVGVDMTLMAAKGKITNVSLLSGDSDFIPAVEAVKQESVLVTLWHGNTPKLTMPSRDLFELCDERRAITQELISLIIR